MKKLIGYRVKDTNTGRYVNQLAIVDGKPPITVNCTTKTTPTSLTAAMLLADHWRDCGYLSHVVPVFRVSK
jgi:hypothetical protein